LNALNFLEGAVVPPATVCGVIPAEKIVHRWALTSQLEVTRNCAPSLPCSAVLERSDSAGVKAGGGVAGELVDASAAPFAITLSCTWCSRDSMCASLDATLEELRESARDSMVAALWAGQGNICHYTPRQTLVDKDTPRMRGGKENEEFSLGRTSDAKLEAVSRRGDAPLCCLPRPATAYRQQFGAIYSQLPAYPTTIIKGHQQALSLSRSNARPLLPEPRWPTLSEVC
jgi:hypothetical protein